MKPQLRFLFAGGAIAALSAAVTYAVAGPPAGSPVQRTITYEGNLTDTQGALQATYPMQFSLWDSESNPTGKLWESTSTNMSVEQTTGRFIAVLGPAIGPELPDNVYETPSLWLAATIDAIPMPRQRIAAVPFAVRAEKAEVAVKANNADAVGGIASSSLMTAQNINNLASAATAIALCNKTEPNTTIDPVAMLTGETGNQACARYKSVSCREVYIVYLDPVLGTGAHVEGAAKIACTGANEFASSDLKSWACCER